MPENILVIEYEPRYTDRVKHALAGQPIEPSFVHDGEEAMLAFDNQKPKLIVLSSVVPKGNTTDLIHAIRQREHLQEIPILLTVSGYTGTSTKQDALRLGATDILPKPFSEGDFLSKVHQMLGRAQGQFTSDQIFGDLLHDAPQAKKPAAPRNDLDKLLKDTLSGVMSQKSAMPKPKTQPGTGDIDKRLADLTLNIRPKTRPAVQHEDNVPISQPVIPKAAPAPPPVEEEEPTDGVRFGQYVLLEKIAAGGMAEVWKARMRGVEGFQKIVAIKKILPHLSDNQDFIEMFIDEAKLAAQLNHNNIIHIYDLGKIQSSYYIAMEYIDGFDLKTILKRSHERDQPMSMDLALFISAKIAAALDYAHRKRDFENKDIGLVHRDVSPQNVLISQEGDIKLCDFGIAKAASKASQTQAGALKGKLQYMSPEQAWGKAIDRRSDVFALATVLFEMLTGRQLFTGESEMSILEQVREARVDAPSKFNDEITPEIDRIALKALQKDPADRFQTAADMAREIDSVLYDFRPTPTSADLAIYMHRLNAAAVVAAPVPEPAPPPPVAPPPTKAKPVAVAAPHTPPGVHMPAWEARRSEGKKFPVVPLVIAAVVVIAAVGGFFALRGRFSAPAAPVQAATSSPAPQQTASTATNVPLPASDPAAATTIVQEAQAPVLDPAKVDEEVRKRLDAARARLEQQQAGTQEPAPRPLPVSAPLRPTPQPIAQPVVRTVPPPSTATQSAAVDTAPPAPAPQPVTQTVAPAPAPVTQTVAETPRTREGDLVASGSEDTPAKMLRRANVPYPPMARMQRVEGTVVVNALISETGRVLDAKVVRGINRAVGLNEAAEQIIRRSTFSPPTKDGVNVKAWTAFPVDFKL